MIKKKITKKNPEEKKEISINSKSQDKELKIIIISMIGLIAIFLLTAWFFDSLKDFEYQGLKFTKERFGEIPVFHYTYSYKNLEGSLIKYNLYLRKDPRKNNVPVEGEIVFPIGGYVYMTINSTGLLQCENALRDYAGLASFLSDNSLPIKSATVDKAEAEANNQDFADCSTYPENVVILTSAGSETKILKENMCYKITINNCEFLDAMEKFKVQAAIDARARARQSSFPK